MKTLYLWITLFVSLLCSRAALAQGPTIDPSFFSGSIYQPGAVAQALRQPDGKTLLLGPFQRVLSQPTGQLARLLPSGTQLDRPFQDSVAALQGSVDRLVPLPSGQFLLLDDISYGVSTSGALTLRGVTRQALLRLNPNGSPDATFDAQLSSAAVLQLVVPQPDGKLLLLGNFRPALGQPGPALIRLNPDGSRDNSFQAVGFTANSTNSIPAFIGLQADGRVVVAGAFDSAGGQPRQGVARLLDTGQLDASFVPQLPQNVEGLNLTVQPDGRILLMCTGGGPQMPPIRRLLADGTNDTSFSYMGPVLSLGTYSKIPPVLQPDGRLLVATSNASIGGGFLGQVLRFNPTGLLDGSFDNAGAATAGPARSGSYPGSIQVLPNGQILVANGRSSPLFRYAPLATSLSTGIALLNSTGTRDASFDPRVQDFGLVYDVALQPDGKMVVGGSFSEINGIAVRNVARLQPNGLVDVSFAATTNETVSAVAVQPDGKVVLGGEFDYLNGSVYTALGRVLPTGATDAAFAPPIIASSPSSRSTVQKLALRPTGEIIAIGYFSIQQASSTAVRVLTQFQAASGQEDTAFQPIPSNAAVVRDMLVLPTGKLLVAGRLATSSLSATPIWRLLANGTLDTGFALSSSTNGDAGTALAQDGAGRLYLGGSIAGFGAPNNLGMARFLADGQPDPTFQTTISGFSPTINTIAVQPNGRVLLGGEVLNSTGNTRQSTLRLLLTGAPDPSYNPDNGPLGTRERSGRVQRLLVQPDGAILAAGFFPQVGSLPFNGLVRLLDSNVLAVRTGHAADMLSAWPVPAHEVLHLALDATARPQQVALLDALGRTVLTQNYPPAELSLNTAGLPPGVYLLRVRYAQGGPVVRRVVLE